MAEFILIPLDRKRSRINFIVTFLVFLLGTFMLIAGLFGITDEGFWSDVLTGAGLPISLLGVGLFILYIRNYLRKDQGLIISEKGITDNCSSARAGFIPWTDIISFAVVKEFTNALVAVKIRKQQAYLDAAKGLKRRIMYENHKLHGTVVVIPVNVLKIDQQELLSLLNENLEKYKTR